MKPWLVVLLLGVVACSVMNREGPDVTCADLDGGAQNACADGIVATCSAGEMRWQVCDDEKACEQSWQQDGRFRCNESDSIPGPSGDGGGSGGTSGTGGFGGGVSGSGGSGGTSGSGGSADAVAVCGKCPNGYSLVVAAVNDQCGGCTCGVAEPGKCAQSVCVLSEMASKVSVATGACPCETLTSTEHKCSPSQVVNICLPCP